MARRTPTILRFGASLGAIGVLSVAPVTVSWAQGAAEQGGAVLDFAVSQSVRASDNADLTDALKTMIDHDGPYVLDVEVPYQEHVLPMIPSGKTVDDIITE